MTVELLDTTLREGEQTPNVTMTIEQKLEIAEALDDFGVEFIELGHPVVSPDVREAVHRLARLDTNAAKIAHGRAHPVDIDAAAECGTPWIGIFFGTSPLSLEHKFGVTQDEALQRIRDAVARAKDHDLNVRFTAEDATRTERDFLIQVSQAAAEAGADRLSFPDTVGTATPGSITELVTDVRNAVDLPIHVHCHNDLGLATANTLAGLEAGAQLADVTVNGLGERSGVAALAEVAVALKVLHGVENGWKLEQLPTLSQIVERITGAFNSENAPIVGMHAFTHKAGLHTRAVLKDPRTYEAFPPELVDQDRNIAVDKYAGREAVRARLSAMNVEITDEQLAEVLDAIKARPQKRNFADVDLLEIADEVLGLELRARVPLEIEAIVQLGLGSALHTTRVTRRLAALDMVKEVYEITGEDDVVAHVVAPSIATLNDFIEELRVAEGVARTTTHLILKGYDSHDH